MNSLCVAGFLCSLRTRLAPSYRWFSEDYSISNVLVMEILQSCTKPSMCGDFNGLKFLLHLNSMVQLVSYPNPMNSLSVWRYFCKLRTRLFPHIDGLVQGYSISSALAMEILQSCTKPSICSDFYGLKYLLHVNSLI